MINSEVPPAFLNSLLVLVILDVLVSCDTILQVCFEFLLRGFLLELYVCHWNFYVNVQSRGRVFMVIEDKRIKIKKLLILAIICKLIVFKLSKYITCGENGEHQYYCSY